MAPANLPRAGGVEGVALDSWTTCLTWSIPWQVRFLRGLRRPDVRTGGAQRSKLEREVLAGREAGGGLSDETARLNPSV